MPAKVMGRNPKLFREVLGRGGFIPFRPKSGKTLQPPQPDTPQPQPMTQEEQQAMADRMKDFRGIIPASNPPEEE
jgi:hypothetical protein